MIQKGGVKGMDCSIQCGDMGVGFPEKGIGYDKDGISYAPEVDKNHKFIRGNHDDPAICRAHPNYAGDWKYYSHPNIFVVGGGFSVDYRMRMPNVTWWEDEELSNRQFGQMFRFYKQYKPRIVVSHECPSVVLYNVATNAAKLVNRSRTEEMLQKMYEYHKPEFWIFGHHHRRKELDKGGVHFVALNELLHTVKISDCIYEIPDVRWE